MTDNLVAYAKAYKSIKEYRTESRRFYEKDLLTHLTAILLPLKFWKEIFPGSLRNLPRRLDLQTGSNLYTEEPRIKINRYIGDVEIQFVFYLYKVKSVPRSISVLLYKRRENSFVTTRQMTISIDKLPEENFSNLMRTLGELLDA